MECHKPEPGNSLDRDIRFEMEKVIESSKKIVDLCDRISELFLDSENNKLCLKKRKIWPYCRTNR